MKSTTYPLQHSLSNQIFERVAVETFDQNKLKENILDAAQKLCMMEQFLVYFAKQSKIDLGLILYDKKFVYSKLRLHLHNFWNNLATFVILRGDNKLCYSESMEILWLWYEENKDNINEIITITKIERLNVKYKDTITQILKQLRDRLNTREYKLSIVNRNNTKWAKIKKIRRYINQLTVIYPHHTVLRIDFGYQIDDFSDKEIAEHMTRFYTCRRHKPELFKTLCGYITKLEYSQYRGRYWRTLLFFNGLHPKSVQIHAQNIGKYWSEVIVKQGGLYQCDVNEQWLEGKMRRVFFKEETLEAALYLCEKDAIIRPNVGIVKLLRTGRISTAKRAKSVPESVPRGRKRRIYPEQITLLKQQGLGVSAIAKKLGISRSSIYKLTAS